MRRHLIPGSLVIVMLAAMVAVGAAQDQPPAAASDWRQWDQGPEGFLLTKDEAKEWKTITTESAAKRFIDLFWARRNPNPDAPFNIFRAQIDALVRYADANFSYEGKRGALTDRGRVMILMGQPHYVENRAPTETVESMDDMAAGTDEVRANAQLWGYDPQRLDPKFKIKGSRLVFVFYEERPTTNIFTMDRSHQDATMAMRALTKAPETHLLHPELTEVPKPVSVPGAAAASAASLALLDQDAPYSDQATVIAEPGVADAGHRPWWVHIELPPGAPGLESMVGRVLSPSGELLSTFERPVESISFGGHTGYHVTFPLETGDYRIELAGVAGGRPVVAYKENITVPDVAADGTWLSGIVVGLYGEKKEDALLGSAYCFGKLHVLPIVDTVSTLDSEVSYFGFLIRPPVSKDGKVVLRSKAQLNREGRRFGRPLEMPIEAVRVADDLFVFANSLNLGALPESGEYTLEFVVSEPESGVSAKRVVELNRTDTELRLVLGESSAWVEERPVAPAIVPDRARADATPTMAGTGTGFVINSEGLVLTNHHVIDNCAAVSINGVPSKVVFLDPGVDLAVLSGEPGRPPARFDFTREPRIGEPVTAVGYPLRGMVGSGIQATSGNVSAVSGLSNDSRYFQISAPINPGNSGGPLFDSAGNVVGVVTAKLDEIQAAVATGTLSQNVNFALRGSVVETFLDVNRVPYVAASESHRRETVDIVEDARSFTVLVECWSSTGK